MGCIEATVIQSLSQPSTMGSSGGAISHIRGFLYGLKSSGRTCRVFSGTPLAQNAFENEIIAPRSRSYFFWAAHALSFNFVFARGVERPLARLPPSFCISGIAVFRLPERSSQDASKSH